MAEKRNDEFVASRIFDAPRELVFAAFTEPKHVMKWWGPEGFSSPECKIDLRPGGEFLFCMQWPNGTKAYNKGYFREIKAPERLVWCMFFSDAAGKVVSASHYGMPADIPLEFNDVFTFEKVEGNKTKLTIHRDVSLEFTKRMRMDEGWDSSLNKLDRALAELKRS